MNERIKLLEKIELLRKKIEENAYNNIDKLYNCEVVKLSEKLDKLIVQYITIGN